VGFIVTPVSILRRPTEEPKQYHLAIVQARPCAFAARAIPPLLAKTFSPYRIGIGVSFHLPACITELNSMFNASKS
jgi:hypothetical protein